MVRHMLVGVTFLLAAVTAAEAGNAFQTFGRWFGYGFGDGYHSCPCENGCNAASGCSCQSRSVDWSRSSYYGPIPAGPPRRHSGCASDGCAASGAQLHAAGCDGAGCAEIGATNSGFSTRAAKVNPKPWSTRSVFAPKSKTNFSTRPIHSVSPQTYTPEPQPRERAPLRQPVAPSSNFGAK